MTGTDLDDLCERIGYRFADPAQALLALRHRSWPAEDASAGPGSSNERLEFLGDAVLGVVVAERLYTDYPDLNVGALAKAKASLVSSARLAEVATELRLGGDLQMGRGAESAGGRHRRSILADALEALIGAVYLDGGPQAARRMVLRLFGERIAATVGARGAYDHKTVLQEATARRSGASPRYRLSRSGPDHRPTWRAIVSVAGADLGTGEGLTKKQAEQAAAAEALTCYPEAPADGAPSPKSEASDAKLSPTAPTRAEPRQEPAEVSSES